MTQKHQILLAEDDHDAAMILKMKLQKKEFETIHVVNGQDAWDYINQAEVPPRLLITDWEMPYLSGPDLCKKIMASEDLPLIYRIVLTSRSKKEDLMEALNNGAHDFLTKPPNEQELLCRLQVGLRLVQAEDKVRRYAEQLEIMAKTDPLTGAANRRHFFEHAEAEIDRSSRYRHPLSILYLDIDHFKNINDSYGHDCGDKVLIGVSELIMDTLRKPDNFSRLGGEEFSILLPETDEDNAYHVAERLRMKISDLSFQSNDGLPFQVTASFGIARLADNETVEGLLLRADAALYEAKSSGRNCCKLATNAATNTNLT